MDSERLMRILLMDNAVEAIGMILSNHADFGHESGCLLSVKKYDDAACDIITYFARRSMGSAKDSSACSHADEYQGMRRSPITEPRAAHRTITGGISSPTTS